MTGTRITSDSSEVPSSWIERTLWFTLVSSALLVVTLSALSSLMLAHTLHEATHRPRACPTRSICP